MDWGIVFLAVIMLSAVHLLFDLKNLLNPFVFFYLYQTIFFFIALSYNESLYPNINISEEIRYFIVISYMGTFLGAFASRALFAQAGIRYVRINDIQQKVIPSREYQVSAFIVFILGFLAWIFFTYKTGGIIIFADDIENERISRKAGAGLVNLIFVSFLLFSFTALLLSGRKHLIVKTVLFLITSFALVSYGSRAPLLKIIIAVYIVATILSTKKLKLKNLAKVFVVLLAILATLEAYRANTANVDVSFYRLSFLRLSWRPFVNIQNVQRIFDFFPAKHPFLWGESYIVDLKLFLPGSNPNFGTCLKEMMNWTFDGGSITTSFVGLGYLNFGKIAFYIWPFFYGFLFNSVYQAMVSRPVLGNHKLLLLLFFSIGVSGSVSTGLFGTLINNILFLLFTFVVHIVFKQLLSTRPLILKLE